MITRKQLIGLLGTYFSRNYQDDKTFQGLMYATLGLQDQVEQNLIELESSAFRKHIPVYHTEKLYALELKPEDKNTKSAYTRFNDPLTYYLTETSINNWDQVIERYGVPSPLSYIYPFNLNDVVSIESITDDLEKPTFTWYQGVDFELRDGAIKFYTDPCKDKKPHTLFLHNIKQDFKWIYKHFGYLLNLESKSSELYRTVVDDIFNSYIDGSSSVDVFGILSEITGNIISRERDTVKAVTNTSITTTKHEYKLEAEHTSRVKAGDKIEPGDSLTNEFTPIYINQLAQQHELAALLLPKRYLGPKYLYGVIFINQSTTLFEQDGQFRFYLGGNQHDIELFWEDFEIHCQHYNTTVNNVLRLAITNSTNQINPYQFFTEHIGRYHYTLLAIDHLQYSTDVTLDQIPIRRLIPPWSALLIQSRMTMEAEISLSGLSDDGMVIESVIEPQALPNMNISSQIYVGRI